MSHYLNWVVRLFPPEKRDRTREILTESRTSVLSWLKGRIFSMIVVGVLATVALYVIGVPGALFLGIFSGLISFIPFIGALAGAVPPLVLAFAGDPIDAGHYLAEKRPEDTARELTAFLRG